VRGGRSPGIREPIELHSTCGDSHDEGGARRDLSEGARRFSELEHSCAGISPRTLSERLRALEQEGVLERHSYAEHPPRVEYELTQKGRALLPIIDEMRNFGHDWLVCEHEPEIRRAS
jgi:DNA-binding HxlR family transcriptional regulator